jgi:hypothetical protein
MSSAHQNIYNVEVQYDARIPMRDGLALSANLFRPIPREPGEKFPAILEMTPYRKDDWRYQSDHQRMTYLAQRGFVGCRLDVRGTGSSPGLALDEYTPVETQDGYDTVEWLAAQPWCSSKVGMWGISYGGFTAIQVAMLQPPSLKAIVPIYATDDRYLDDVHYIGGCVTASELAQYAVGMVGMNAMPPKPEYRRERWAEEWRARLEQTPPWIIEWLRQQTDGPYWRNGSLAPHYERITCAIFHIGGWTDGYTNAVLRMQEKCLNAPRKALIGNWVHALPDTAYPGPNLDWLHEMVRFFDYWLKNIDNGVMVEPAITLFLREYTEPEPFPRQFNGHWHSESSYPIERTQWQEFFLGESILQAREQRSGGAQEDIDSYPHRPTLGTRAGLCWGAGGEPNGLARDLRPDEALSLTYTSAPLAEPLDVIGFPQVVLYVRCSAPVAHLVARLTDVAPDGTSAWVSAGILNLTHRQGHEQPQPLSPDQVYEINLQLKATGYRFLPGHRLRLSVASAYWPVIWPSPYRAMNYLHRGSTTPSRLILPVIPPSQQIPVPPQFKTSPPELIDLGSVSSKPAVWQITEDVINQSVTVKAYGADAAELPNGVFLATTELLELTAYHNDPAYARLYNECSYLLKEHGYETHIRSSGTYRSTHTDFHVELQLVVTLNGQLFFQKSWLESIPRRLV